MSQERHAVKPIRRCSVGPLMVTGVALIVTVVAGTAALRAQRPTLRVSVDLVRRACKGTTDSIFNRRCGLSVYSLADTIGGGALWPSPEDLTRWAAASSRAPYLGPLTRDTSV